MPFEREYQLPLFDPDPLIKLGEVERILAQIISPVPSRPTLIKYCESGTFLGQQVGPGLHWHVFTSSLDDYILKFRNKFQKAA